MKILFLNLSNLVFTVSTPATEPLGGSESCICYLARQLAADGHDVSLMARLPDLTAHQIMGVKHYPVITLKDANFFASEIFDAIVVCNLPLACPPLRMLNPKSLIILWDHVPPDQPSISDLGNGEVLKSFDAIVYVSEWQKQVTESRFNFTKQYYIIGNGLTPSFENLFRSQEELLKAKQNRAAYTTIPYRGLAILLKSMQGLHQETQLDIFSSMRVYQMADDAYLGLYKQAENDPRIHYHGSVSQTELAERLKSSAFLTYPSICEETYCISALEAMAAGMKVISTRLGALETTTMGYADLIPVTSADGQELVTNYQKAMERNILAFLSDPKEWSEAMFEQVTRVNQASSWKVRTREWEKILSQKHS